MALIDTHAHLDGFAQKGEFEGMRQRACQAGLEAVIAIGTAPDDWGLHRDLARAHYGWAYHTVGVHPCSVGPDWAEAVGRLEAFWRETPVPVALGECGLDRFHLPKAPAEAEVVFARQQAAWRAQLEIARRLNCPLVVHSRGAFRECVEAIDASGIDWARVVFHCFSEGEAEIDELKRRGGRGSFTGILTYKNADNVRAAARRQGLERLMLETDAPYLAPVPRRGERNEPAYLRHIAEHAAAWFGVGFDELAAATTANARAFFGL